MSTLKGIQKRVKKKSCPSASGMKLAELGWCAVHVSPIDPSFFPVRLVAVACRHHWSRNYLTHTRIIKGQCRHAARLPSSPPTQLCLNQATEMLPCAATTARYYCFIDIAKLRYLALYNLFYTDFMIPWTCVISKKYK